MHGQRLDITDGVARFIDANEAADSQVLDLSNQGLVRDVRVLIVVSMHYKALKCLRTACLDNSVILQPWKQKPYAILTYPVNAFNIGAIPPMIAHKHDTSHADNLELALLTVSMQVPRQRLRDEVHLNQKQTVRISILAKKLRSLTFFIYLWSYVIS